LVIKLSGMLGLIKWGTKEFDNSYTTKTLFISLVRLIPKYESHV